ncbi:MULTISPECIES: isocyanide synthase family protein [unclassified Crossiella]|uniref:isocyanide synthase family protein n=1 Tax=unclassified Crossiella TaxID=2620835 RepID=UPI001FFEE7D1|nr:MULTISPECIES: isocyanide synthase family protein [unclassified Crossiella]MCK2237445.1 isocyanide synthase family protein [Crossiella sp. S99.2]MCK2251100.1 isocyanide synthase family protein [Crossiella sp. S99.1]
MSEEARRVAETVLELVLRHQRKLGGPAGGCAPRCARCLAAQLGQVERSVAAGVPVVFVLPAFPGKSPNEAKVLGAVPDLAERLALEFLDTLIADIGAVYPPGAELVIGSDGRVFGDVVGIPDADITTYQRELQVMIDGLPGRRIRLFTLDDIPLLAGQGHHRARELLVEGFAEDLDVIRERVRAGVDVELYRALTRFLFEDGDTPAYQGSRAALQRSARARAYLMMQRSKAWGDLLVEYFPSAVRLSIHPQPCGATKLGIHLAETADSWLTPWHSVAVDLGDRFVLMKRAEAEAAGAELVSRDGRPSHFALSRSRVEVA